MIQANKYKTIQLVFMVSKSILYPHYHCLIVAENSKSLECYFEVFNKWLKNRNIKIRHSKGQFSFYFLNHSVIEGITAIPNHRGKRANTILYDDFIDEEILNTIIRPMERKYKR